MSKPIPTPIDAGHRQNLPKDLPKDVRTIAGLRDEVVAWTCLDPALDKTLDKYAFWCTFGRRMAHPLRWPALIVRWPRLLSKRASLAGEARNTYFILTTKELKVVTLEYDRGCVGGWVRSGVVNRTIPLENITHAGSDARGTGWANNRKGDMPTIYFDTASAVAVRGVKQHDVVGLGLKDSEWFVDQVLIQRDAVKGRVA
ncbi:MAG: hypothetical protein ACRDL7_03250 [Gaiellaceae bacterium]